MKQEKRIELKPVGRVEVDESQGLYRLHIDPAYCPVLKGLGSCTHAIILWWADQFDGYQGDLVVVLPYEPGLRSGVFANRSEARPNPIAITTSNLINVDEEAGTVGLVWVDAFNGTPVLDIKPYMPMSDRVMSADYPEWLQGFPDSMEEAAAFFYDPENAVMFS